MRELQREVGVSLSGIDYHLHALEREGEIVTISDDHYRRSFSTHLVLPTEARRLGERDRAFLAECRRPSALAIILSLATEGPLRHAEIRERIGKSKGPATYHLSRLVSLGIVHTLHESSLEKYELTDLRRSVALLVTFSGELRDHTDAFARMWQCLVD